MDTRVVHVLVALVLLFGSIDGSHFRGGIITFKPSSTTPNAMDFSARLAYRRSKVYCDNTRISSKQLLSTYYESWELRRYSHGYSSSTASLKVYCDNFNVGEDWIEGYNNFTLSWGSSYEKYWKFRIYGGNWISAITRAYSSDNVDLSTRYNITARQNNSSPVSNISLTVYAIEGIPSVITIPVHDPDGDIVRCRNANYSECHQGVCTNWPYGAIHEENCTISYNGSGYNGQLLPVYLKLEDYVNGTTQFEPSQSLGSVGLQFIIHIKNEIGLTIERSSQSCGQYNISKNPPSGHFTSPGYPHRYSNSESCSWKITSPSNTRIGLYFKTFETEPGYDNVKVYDGGSASSRLIGSYSGSTIPPAITSTYNVLYITFTSDGSQTSKGFAAYFEGHT